MAVHPQVTDIQCQVYPCNLGGQSRVPYGVAGVPGVGGMPTVGGVPVGSVPAVGGVPGMAGVAGITGVPAGMTAVPGMAGVTRVPNGMSSIYATEKPTAGLYPGGSPAAAYQGLVQPTYLQQAQTATGQPSYYAAAAAAGQQGYLSASSPTSQPRYMVSPAYTAAGTLSPQGYALSAGGSYATLQGQPGATSLTPQAVPVTVATSTLSSASQTATQSPYPATYLGSQLGAVQISPSQSPYAGHPLYPSSPYAGLQVQPAQMNCCVNNGEGVILMRRDVLNTDPTEMQPGQMPTRVGSAYNTATGLPLGYPQVSTMDAVRASFYPPY